MRKKLQEIYVRISITHGDVYDVWAIRISEAAVKFIRNLWMTRMGISEKKGKNFDIILCSF